MISEITVDACGCVGEGVVLSGGTESTADRSGAVRVGTFGAGETGGGLGVVCEIAVDITSHTSTSHDMT